MSEAVVTVEDAAFRLAELVEEVSASGEAAVLTKAGRAVARITPIAPLGGPPDERLAKPIQAASR